MLRLAAISCVALLVLAIGAEGQCPDGTPPPCTAPPRAQPRGPRIGVGSIKVLSSTPVAGTNLNWQDLEKGVPLHVVVEHAVQSVPAGYVPLLVAFVNLTPEKTNRGQQLVLESRVITPRPVQRGLDWVLTRDFVRAQRITIEIHIAFSAAKDTIDMATQGLRVGFDWAASMTLEFPVDSSAVARPPAIRGAAREKGRGSLLARF